MSEGDGTPDRVRLHRVGDDGSAGCGGDGAGDERDAQAVADEVADLGQAGALVGHVRHEIGRGRSGVEDAAQSGAGWEADEPLIPQRREGDVLLVVQVVVGASDDEEFLAEQRQRATRA